MKGEKEWGGKYKYIFFYVDFPIYIYIYAADFTDDHRLSTYKNPDSIENCTQV